MVTENKVKDLKLVLDITNSNLPPHLRRENEFQEIKDLLERFIAMDADVDFDADFEMNNALCPVCHTVTMANPNYTTQLYCTHCGQLIKTGGNE